MEEHSPAIGIDLGTTNSCVAVFQYQKIEIIPNDQGYRTTPSIVAFTENERFIGNPAKDQIAENTENTVCNVKRLIGRQFNEEAVQRDINLFSSRIVNQAGKPKISVSYKGNNKRFIPEEISAMVLEKMKNVAETYVECEVKNAVITVPAYFNDEQRRATRDAGTIAGLNVLRIINEPTAAAIAYGLDQKTEGEQTVLIYDLGGGTFDVSILKIADNVFNVIATDGNPQLGGEDFDSRMVKHFVQEILEVNEKDLQNDRRALRRLRTACEQAKIILSGDDQTTVQVPSLFDGIDFKSIITRTKFQDLCYDLFESTIVQVENTLRAANLEKADIDEVILVGGSSHIPMVQKLLTECFDNKTLNKSISPDEAVAYGAAVHAAVLNGDKAEEIQDILLLDNTPMSLGIETQGGIMTKLINRNLSIPAEKTKLFSTTYDNQPSVLIKVYEGERTLTKDNHFLGDFQLIGIPNAPRKVPQIEVTFKIDADRILEVSAVEKNSGQQRKITIKEDKRRLTEEQIDMMIREFERYREDDEEKRDKIKALNSLKGHASQFRSTVKETGFKARMSEEEIEQVDSKVKAVQRWIIDNPDATKEEFGIMQRELIAVCNPVLTLYYERSASVISNNRPILRPDSEILPSTSARPLIQNNDFNDANSENAGPDVIELN